MLLEVLKYSSLILVILSFDPKLYFLSCFNPWMVRKRDKVFIEPDKAKLGVKGFVLNKEVQWWLFFFFKHAKKKKGRSNSINFILILFDSMYLDQLNGFLVLKIFLLRFLGCL